MTSCQHISGCPLHVVGIIYGINIEGPLGQLQVVNKRYCRRLLLFMWQKHNNHQISSSFRLCSNLPGRLLLRFSEVTEIRVGTRPGLLDEIRNRSWVPIGLSLFVHLTLFVFQSVIIVVSWVRQELFQERNFMKKLRLFCSIHLLAVWIHHIQLFAMPAFHLGSPIPSSQVTHKFIFWKLFLLRCGCLCRLFRSSNGITAIVVGLLQRLPLCWVLSRSSHSQSCSNTATVKSGKRMLGCNNPPNCSLYLTVAIVEVPIPWPFFTKPYPSNQFSPGNVSFAILT
jgi:hypothetical protein